MVASVEEKINNDAEKPISDLPEGQYRIVSWAIDTTGRRISDEICQIAAYTPTSQFRQYIMPYRNLNVFTQRRHGLRIITVRRFRLLKDLRSNRFLKTKSEISALIGFLNWLETVKGDNPNGIILMYHEPTKTAPAILVEAFKRYNLYDKFANIVKGFYNNFTLAEIKCGKTLHPYSLKVLSRVLLNKYENLSNAVDRARICYNLVQYFGRNESKRSDINGKIDVTFSPNYTEELVHQHTYVLESVEKYIAELKNYVIRQSTFRPVFKELMSFNWISRQKATRLRRALVENDLDFDKIKESWDNGGKNSVEELLMKLSLGNRKDYSDILEIVECHFDSSKKMEVGKFIARRRNLSATNKKSDQQQNDGNTPSSETSADSDSSSLQSKLSCSTHNENIDGKIKTPTALTAEKIQAQ